MSTVLNSQIQLTANHVVVYYVFTETNLHISGPMQFKPTVLKATVHTMAWDSAINGMQYWYIDGLWDHGTDQKKTNIKGQIFSFYQVFLVGSSTNLKCKVVVARGTVRVMWEVNAEWVRGFIFGMMELDRDGSYTQCCECTVTWIVCLEMLIYNANFTWI